VAHADDGDDRALREVQRTDRLLAATSQTHRRVLIEGPADSATTKNTKGKTITERSKFYGFFVSFVFFVFFAVPALLVMEM
jgi:hypothetical protein